MRLACPVCGLAESVLLLARERSPVLQNALYRTREEAVAAPCGDLHMRRCRNCDFVWNAAFVPTLINYSVDYENCQSHSHAFSSHLDAMADHICRLLLETGAVSIVEIGCGQGDFLARLSQRVGLDRVKAVGFDPSWRGEDGTGPNGASIYRRLFDRSAATAFDLEPDLVLTRHTIEHVSEPIEFLALIRAALPPTSSARLCIETPCNRWIQANSAVHDFFYEHCSLFSAGSIARALTTTGFTATRIENVFGGQYLWTEATAEAADSDSFDSERFVQRWRVTLNNARAAGPIAVWGANAKGSTFLLMVDPSHDLVDCVIDINPKKQDHFVPTTGHRIVGPAAAGHRKIATVIVMNPNYTEEIRAMALALSWNPHIIVLE